MGIQSTHLQTPYKENAGKKIYNQFRNILVRDQC